MRMTQRELADRLRVTSRTIMRWEGGHSEPSGAVLELLDRIVAEQAA